MKSTNRRQFESSIEIQLHRRIAAVSEQIAKTLRLTIQHSGELRAAVLIRLRRVAPVLHVRQAIRHVVYQRHTVRPRRHRRSHHRRRRTGSCLLRMRRRRRRRIRRRSSDNTTGGKYGQNYEYPDEFLTEDRHGWV